MEYFQVLSVIVEIFVDTKNQLKLFTAINTNLIEKI